MRTPGYVSYCAPPIFQADILIGLKVILREMKFFLRYSMIKLYSYLWESKHLDSGGARGEEEGGGGERERSNSRWK